MIFEILKEKQTLHSFFCNDPICSMYLYVCLDLTLSVLVLRIAIMQVTLQNLQSQQHQPLIRIH